MLSLFLSTSKRMLRYGYTVCSLLLPSSSQGQHKNAVSETLPTQRSGLGGSRKVSLSGEGALFSLGHPSGDCSQHLSGLGDGTTPQALHCWAEAGTLHAWPFCCVGNSSPNVKPRPGAAGGDHRRSCDISEFSFLWHVCVCSGDWWPMEPAAIGQPQ